VPSVSRLNVTPVKGLALQHPDSIAVGLNGVEENRRFYLVDAAGRLFNGKREGRLVQVRADYDHAAAQLALAFPDGERIEGEVTVGEAVETSFYGRPVDGRVVDGPWGAALSRFAGTELRLVRAERASAACDVHPVTLLSDASLARLGHEFASGPVDGRRFRMLVALAGCEAHEEDGWDGRAVRLGEAVVRVHGPTGRCAVTTHDPESGRPTLDTLRAILGYRGALDDGVPAFGVYALVERPGVVRVGDPVTPLG
jgi:uncharacterized protein YcbX